MPYMNILTDAGTDVTDRLHPNSVINGSMSNEYTPRVLEETMRRKNVVIATIHA
jgi:hypothetical protein